MSNNSELHFLQQFEVKKIHRSEIKLAEYNPRLIPDQHKKDLKKSLKKIKLREPLIWNRSSGNLVGGHQRLDILDEEWQRKYNNLDYHLTVVVVDLSLKEEIELNIALNNPRLMGDYDIDKMNQLLTSDWIPEIDYEIAGIKAEDLQVFGIDKDLQNLENTDVDKIISDFEQVKEQRKAEVPPEVKAERKEAVKAAKSEVKKNEVDTYVTLSFSNQAAKRSFMEKIGEQVDSLYIKGEVFVEKFFKE